MNLTALSSDKWLQSIWMPCERVHVKGRETTGHLLLYPISESGLSKLLIRTSVNEEYTELKQIRCRLIVPINYGKSWGTRTANLEDFFWQERVDRSKPTANFRPLKTTLQKGGFFVLKFFNNIFFIIFVNLKHKNKKYEIFKRNARNDLDGYRC